MLGYQKHMHAQTDAKNPKKTWLRDPTHIGNQRTTRKAKPEFNITNPRPTLGRNTNLVYLRRIWMPHSRKERNWE